MPHNYCSSFNCEFIFNQSTSKVNGFPIKYGQETEICITPDGIFSIFEKNLFPPLFTQNSQSLRIKGRK